MIVCSCSCCHPVCDLTWENFVIYINTYQHITVTVETSHVLMASDRNQTCGEWMSQTTLFVTSVHLHSFGHRPQSIRTSVVS